MDAGTPEQAEVLADGFEVQHDVRRATQIDIADTVMAMVDAAIDAAVAALEKALPGADHRAIKKAIEALNRATESFAARRMDEGIKRALAGRRIGSL